MKFSYKVLCLTFIGLQAFGFYNCYSQNSVTEEQVIEQINELSKQAAENRANLDHYFEPNFSIHLKQRDLLSSIKGQTLFKLKYYHHLAHEYTVQKLYRQSVKNGRDFLDLYNRERQNLPMDQIEIYDRRKSFNLGQLSLAYSKLNLLDSAEIYHKRNLKWTQKLDRLTHASAINNYGIFLFLDKKAIDSALAYFLEAKTLIKEMDSTQHFYGSVIDNIADVYVEKGSIKEARNLYHDNYEFYKYLMSAEDGTKDYRRLISAGCQFITSSLQVKNLEHVEQVYNELDSLKNNHPERLGPETELEFLSTKEQYMVFKDNIGEAYETSKLVKEIEEEIAAQNAQLRGSYRDVLSDNTIKRIRTNYELEKQNQANKIQSQRLKLWVISLGGILLISFFAFLYYRRKKKLLFAMNAKQLAEKNLEISSLRNKQLQTEIENKKRDLSDFAINLTHGQEWARVLSQQVEKVKESKGRKRSLLIKDLEEEIKNKVEFDSNTKDFYHRLDELSHSFYKRLKQRFPKLSKTEERLCSLIRLRIDSKEIATLQNITLSSLNTSRYRLRKKLNLNGDQDLDDFIRSL